MTVETIETPPTAPGSLGAPIDSRLLLQYLEGLQRWHQGVRARLTAVDEWATGSQRAAIVADITLAMALNEAVERQLDRIVALWDSGRVGAVETTAISTLIWGRLDDNLDAALSLSFVEACALASTLVRSLADRLDASGATLGARYAQLIDRADVVERLAARCRDRIAGAPTIAVPDPSVLGAPPTDATGFSAYSARLDAVESALTQAFERFDAPLRERDELRSVLGAYLDMAAARGVTEDPMIVAAEQRARSVLWTAPCDLVLARGLVTGLQAAVRAAGGRDQGATNHAL